jgi:hypothetical protein
MKKLLVLSALALALVACGGDDKKPADPSSQTNTTADPSKTPSTTPSTPSTGTGAPAGTGSATPDPTKK